MANWLKLNVHMESRKDVEALNQRRIQNERLGIEDDEEEDIEVQAFYKPVMLDADKISSYAPFYHDDGQEDAETSEVVFDSGDYVRVQMPFAELDLLIRKVKTQDNG